MNFPVDENVFKFCTSAEDFVYLETVGLEGCSNAQNRDSKAIYTKSKKYIDKKDGIRV